MNVIFVISVGWNEKNPKLNHLVAPFIGVVNKTPTISTTDIPKYYWRKSSN